jgi:hypothetical protein
MKKLQILLTALVIGFAINSLTTTEALAQSKKRLLKTEAAKYTIQVDTFVLIFEDTQGQMDVHDTMKKINPEHNPVLNVIKDEKLGIWRIATTLEEANKMPDKMNVVSAAYDKILPYKRTGYIK